MMVRKLNFPVATRLRNIQANHPPHLLTLLPALFVQVPHQSISYIWQVTGCQHTLQPGDDDYAAPSIPALTLKGFVRWESIEILLAPEEHVPFLQYAVRNWALRNPDDGTPFPTDIPADCFPPEADPEVDRWHRDCAAKLRAESAAKEEPKPPSPASPDPRVKEAYSHVRAPNFAAAAAGAAAGVSAAAAAASARLRPEPDYVSRPVGVSYAHVPGRYPPSRPTPGMAPRSPDRDRNRSRDRDRYLRTRPGSSDERAGRRSSVSGYPSPTRDPPVNLHVPLERRGSGRPRRHSHPRQYDSSSETEDGADYHIPQFKRRSSYQPHSPPPPSFRRVFIPSGSNVRSPSVGVVPPSPASVAPPAVMEIGRPSGSGRGEEPKRKSFPLPFDLKEKIAGFIPVIGGSQLQRNGSKTRRDKEVTKYSREHLGSAKGSRSWSGDAESEFDDTEDSRGKSHRLRRDRERGRDGIRDRDRDRNGDRLTGRERDRERQRERDNRDRRDREKERERGRPLDHGRRRDRDVTDDDIMDRRNGYSQRPELPRRTSSHADVDRKRDSPREDRWRRESRSRVPSPVVTGVTGRRYPTETWN